MAVSEYLVATVRHEVGEDRVIAENVANVFKNGSFPVVHVYLNEKAADGWEVVAAYGVGAEGRLILKRPKKGNH